MISDPDLTSLSIVVPAYNEETALPTTLAALKKAAESLENTTAEILVVDNASRDRTAAIARSCGVTVVEEPVQSIARARNRGAAESSGQLLVFVDADVAIPSDLLQIIAHVLRDPSCVGGGFEVRYRPRKRLVRVYLWAWRILGRRIHAVQGAVQFCRREVFELLGGYDETMWMGEDVEFFWRLRKAARAGDRRVEILREPEVTASARRFDQWPVFRTLVYTNPLFVGLLRKRQRMWSGWYGHPPR